MQDECVNNPNGIRDCGSASDTAMDDLKPGAQPWASSFYRIPKVLGWTCDKRVTQTGASRAIAMAGGACEMSVLTIQTGLGMVAVLLILPWTM